jgi:CHAP domain
VVRSAALLLGLTFCACATQSASRRTELPTPELPPTQHELWAPFPEAVAPPGPDFLGAQISSAATSLVGLKGLTNVSREVPDDCTGLVRVAYYAAGVDLMARGNFRGENGVSAIWRAAEAANATHFGTPRPGDLVFFLETYDRNRDGQRNDGRTHVAVVESVDADGTVFFVHRSGGGVTRSQLNLAQPGRPLNPILRPRSKKLPAYDTGELFAGYASPAGLLALVPTPPRAVVVRDVDPPVRQARKAKRARRP